MASGNPPQEQNSMYPEESLQAFVASPTSSWWTTNKCHDLRRGRLLLAFVPHVDLVPMTMVPEGRSSPTDHTKANYSLQALNINEPSKYSRLPVAALPLYEGEDRVVYRAKKRPVLVVSSGGPEIPKALRSSSKPKWQTSPTVLVAPYYGADEGVPRAGWYPELVKRIQRCEYPQYMWDKLPLSSRTNGSILRLDHIQPIGRHHNSYEHTEYVLNEDAILALDEWLMWIMTDKLQQDGILLPFREGLLTL